jgi:hypothetical protein
LSKGDVQIPGHAEVEESEKLKVKSERQKQQAADVG